MGSYKNHRRWLLLSAFDAQLRLEFGLASALRGKQQGLDGTPLDTTWPGYAQLKAAFYTTREDLDGADAAELTRIAGLSRPVAEAAIKRLGT